MRTNINIPDDLHARFASACRQAGVHMATVIQSYMIDELASPVRLAILKQRAASAARGAPSSRHSEALAERNADIIRRVAAGETQIDIAADYGLTKSAISKILSRNGG